MIDILDPYARNLSHWRRELLLRDCVTVQVKGVDMRVGSCVLCGGHFSIHSLQAHHILPKASFPDLALRVRNGVMLCGGCHIGIVHNGNPAMDISTWSRWRFFVGLFEGYTRGRTP